MSEFKEGDIVVITKNRNNGGRSGHSYKKGAKYRIKETYGSSSEFGKKYILKTLKSNYSSGGWIYDYEMELEEPPTRKGKAKHLKTKVLPAKKKELAALKAEIKNIEGDIKRYEKYDSVEAETAHLLSACIKSGGDVKAIEAVLKSTNLLSKVSD